MLKSRDAHPKNFTYAHLCFRLCFGCIPKSLIQRTVVNCTHRRQPLPGSLQAAPIAMSYGWAEVSLSLRMGLRLKWYRHSLIAWQNRSHSIGSANKAYKNKNRQNGRGAPATWLSFMAMRGTYRIRLYLVVKER